MRCLVQRVQTAAVHVGGECIAAIGPGLLLLIGATHTDTHDDAEFVANKVAHLRIFADAEGKMNRSALETEAEMLVVSQFTLYGDIRKGRRPSFIASAPPEVAAPLVESVATALERLGLRVSRGRFGAEMAVSLVNDGPVTIWVDTDALHGVSRTQ